MRPHTGSPCRLRLPPHLMGVSRMCQRIELRNADGSFARMIDKASELAELVGLENILQYVGDDYDKIESFIQNTTPCRRGAAVARPRLHSMLASY